MIKLGIGIAVGILFTTTALAGNVNGYVQDHYKSIIKQQPHNLQVCRDVYVPNRVGPDDMITGAILGGIIGKGKGNTIATATGAVIGSQIGKNNTQKNIVGYKRVTVCEDNPTYQNTTQLVYSHSTIRFADGSRQYDITFKKQ